MFYFVLLLIPLIFAMTKVRAENISEFICANIKTLNLSNDGVVLDNDLSLEFYQSKFVFDEKKITQTFLVGGENFFPKLEFNGKWIVSKKFTHQFVKERYGDGDNFTSIQWTKYGLGIFKKYPMDNYLVSLYSCVEI